MHSWVLFLSQRIGSSSISMRMSRLIPPLREVSKCCLTCYNWKTWWPHFGLELYSRPKLCWATLKVWYLVRAHNESFKASPLLCTFFFWSDDGDQISCKQIAQLFGALHEKHGNHASVPFLVKERIMNKSGVRKFYYMLICVCVCVVGAHCQSFRGYYVAKKLRSGLCTRNRIGEGSNLI